MIPISKPTIVRKDLEYVLNCLITERLEEGELTREFEKAISHYIGMKYALASSSFTSAVHLALLGLGIQPNDEIIISAFSSPAIVNAIRYINAVPVLADIEMNTYNIDFKQVEKKITTKTKAVIVSHNFGIPSNIDQYLSLEIPIIEDCSLSFGADYKSSINKSLEVS